jgi:hypothetical protein
MACRPGKYLVLDKDYKTRLSMKVYYLLLGFFLLSSCSLMNKKEQAVEHKRNKSFQSITVGERGGFLGKANFYRLLDDGQYLQVNDKGNWDTIGRVQEEQLQQAAMMLKVISNLEVKSLGDGDGSTLEYKVEANLKPSGYVYYLWPAGRKKVPQELINFYGFILQLNPNLSQTQRAK